jgi:hypothetical protein
MKKIQLVLLVLFLTSFGLMAQSGGKPKYLKPTNFTKKVSTITSGKTRNYYSLHTVKPSVITVTGPGKLRVISRGRFKPAAGVKIKYEIFYTVDAGARKSALVNAAERSKNATYLNETLGVPAQNREFEIEIESGTHNIEFLLKDSIVPVAVRYVFTPAKQKKQEWMAYSPLQPSEPVDLISKESTVTYYRFSTTKPLKIEINGPAELRLMSRIEMQYQMKGKIDYRVQVKENDKVLNTYQLSSDRSESAAYKDRNDLIPGKAREFVIDVPKGKHIYEIGTLDQDKNTVLGRIMLPKKDVKLVK